MTTIDQDALADAAVEALADRTWLPGSRFEVPKHSRAVPGIDSVPVKEEYVGRTGQVLPGHIRPTDLGNGRFEVLHWVLLDGSDVPTQLSDLWMRLPVPAEVVLDESAPRPDDYPGPRVLSDVELEARWKAAFADLSWGERCGAGYEPMTRVEHYRIAERLVHLAILPLSVDNSAPGQENKLLDYYRRQSEARSKARHEISQTLIAAAQVHATLAAARPRASARWAPPSCTAYSATTGNRPQGGDSNVG